MKADRRWNGRKWVYDAVDHIDGNPLNNDPANLRVVEVVCNRQDAPPADPWDRAWGFERAEPMFPVTERAGGLTIHGRTNHKPKAFNPQPKKGKK